MVEHNKDNLNSCIDAKGRDVEKEAAGGEEGMVMMMIGEGTH